MDEPKKPMDRQKKEAKRRAGLEAGKWIEVATNGAATVPLSGRNGTAEITTLPYVDWAFDWRMALQGGDFGTFASAVLDDDNFAEWARIRPTNNDVVEFLGAWGDYTGEDLGESQAS